MESLTKNKQSIEVLTYMVKVQFNELCIRIEELKEGWFNVAYKVTFQNGKEVILKIAPNPTVPVMTYEKNMMRSEVTFMRLAKSLGIPCPLVIYYDDTKRLCSADYFFMEKLEGHNLEHVREQLPKDILKDIYQTVGKLTNTWNTPNNYPYFGYIQNPELQGQTWKEAFHKMMNALISDGIKNNVDIGLPYEMIRDILKAFDYTLDEVQKPHFVHWDLWDSNIFIHQNKVSGILDFERGFYGDPLAEALFRMKNLDQLEGYGKTTFTEHESIRLALYDLYLYLVMVIEDSYRHYEIKDIYEYGKSQLKNTIESLISKK